MFKNFVYKQYVQRFNLTYLIFNDLAPSRIGFFVQALVGWIN